MGHSYRSDPRGLAQGVAELLGADWADRQPRVREWPMLRLAGVWRFGVLGEQAALARRFQAACAGVARLAPGAGNQRRTPSYQGFVKALRRHREALTTGLPAALRERLPRLAGPAWQAGPWVPLAVDGTRIDAPRSRSCQEAFGEGSRKGSAPQLELTAIWHLGVHAWHDYCIGAGHASERTLLRQMLDRLPERAMLLADAGFIGYDLCRDLHQRGVKFLWRVGANVRLLSELGTHAPAGKNLVWRWPQDRRDQPPLLLRLIRVGRGRKQQWLVTNVLDPCELPKRMAAGLYRQRWGIECAYRSLKQTFSRAKLRSQAADLAQLELAGSVLGHWLLARLSLRARGPTLGPRDWSPARSAEALRAILTGQAPSRGWRSALRAVLPDPPKPGPPRKRTRQKWVRKNQHQEPGAPRLRPATPAELQAAAGLMANVVA